MTSKGFGEFLKTGGASESLMLFNTTPVKDDGKGADGVEFRLVHLYHQGSPDPAASGE